jgi:hypothetical protein
MITYRDALYALILTALCCLIMFCCQGCASIPAGCSMDPDSGYINCDIPHMGESCVEIAPNIYDCTEGAVKPK